MLLYKEVRIGNIIHIAKSTDIESRENRIVPRKVVGLLHDQIYYESISEDSQIPLYIEIKLVHPIYLTDEILLSIGFKKSTNGQTFFFDGLGNAKLWLSKEDAGYFIMYGTEVYANAHNPIQTLHHLQNCYFDLIGKELVLTNLEME